MWYPLPTITSSLTTETTGRISSGTLDDTQDVSITSARLGRGTSPLLAKKCCKKYKKGKRCKSCPKR